MARVNPFMNVMSDDQPATGERPALDYTIKGASRSILNSIDEMADRADRLLEGETVIELAPDIVDPSFATDRLEEDETAFAELLNAIEDRGQDSPILVRPHPKASGRYMVVFGHRRLRAAKTLGRKVRAVVKSLEDRDHLIAQGQENSARANLSFIERAAFANHIVRKHFDNDNAVALSALSIDRATLSKMLSVASISQPILDAVGAARGIGRDRWYELKALLEKPANLDRALEYVTSDEFNSKIGDERFNSLLAQIKSSRRSKNAAPAKPSRWTSENNSLVADAKSDVRTFTLSLRAKDAVSFGKFLSTRLPDLYAEYQAQPVQQGD